MDAQKEAQTKAIKRAKESLAHIERVIANWETKEKPHWGNVGDANRLADDLQKIVRYTRNLR